MRDDSPHTIRIRLVLDIESSLNLTLLNFDELDRNIRLALSDWLKTQAYELQLSEDIKLTFLTKGAHHGTG